MVKSSDAPAPTRWTAFGGRPGARPTWSSSPPTPPRRVRGAIEELAEACRGAAKDRRAGLADTDHAFVAAGKNNPNPLFVHDRVHLSKAGHAIVAETVLKAIEQKQKERSPSGAPRHESGGLHRPAPRSSVREAGRFGVSDCRGRGPGNGWGRATSRPHPDMTGQVTPCWHGRWRPGRVIAPSINPIGPGMPIFRPVIRCCSLLHGASRGLRPWLRTWCHASARWVRRWRPGGGFAGSIREILPWCWGWRWRSTGPGPGPDRRSNRSLCTCF